MTFNQIMQQIVDLDTEEKIQLAAKAFYNLQPVFEQFDPEYKGMGLIYALLGTTVVADGKLTDEEFRFIGGMLSAINMELTEDQIIELCAYTAETKNTAYSIVKDLRDHLDDAGVAELITFIAALCAIDDTIDEKEVELIRSLF